MAGKKLFCVVLLFLAALIPQHSRAGGVTIITHGYDGDVTGWIAAMADQIPQYYDARYPELGTNFSIYTVTLTTDGSGDYYYQWSRDLGSSPSNTPSGEIIIKLDWTQLAGGIDPYEPYDISTYVVASVVSPIILQTNAISDLNGHALAEYPIHLIGHSRGGSLMAQLSLLLGTNGLWVDQLTTIDPHPLNNDGNDDSPISVIDAPAQYTYANILFADNYWENLGDAYPSDLDPHGEPVAGAYQRQLTSLSGGYPPVEFDFFDDYEYHSNTHLWYFGTMDTNTPVSYDDDGETVTITSSMRSSWWVAYEEQGAIAGFYYSLIGGGNRMSEDHPLGLPSDPAIINGYNQWWNFGAGTSSNRTALPANNGIWPNLIQFNIAGTNSVTPGEPITASFYYQYGGPSTNLTAQFYFGGDFNPYDSKNTFVTEVSLPGTGINYVDYDSVSLSTSNFPPGTYSVFGKISDGTHTRFLYAPQLVTIHPPPTVSLGIAQLGSQFIIRIHGPPNQTAVLQSSANLQTWQPIATNLLNANAWLYTNTIPASSPRQFFRAILLP
jgi:hypothetical protein